MNETKIKKLTEFPNKRKYAHVRRWARYNKSIFKIDLTQNGVVMTITNKTTVLKYPMNLVDFRTGVGLYTVEREIE